MDSLTKVAIIFGVIQPLIVVLNFVEPDRPREAPPMRVSLAMLQHFYSNVRTLGPCLCLRGD